MPGRRRSWADVRYAGDAVAADGFLKTDLLAELPDMDTKTVVRIILDVWAVYSEAEETQNQNAVDFAIGVTSQEAFIAETLPDPNAVGDYPQSGWLYAACKPISLSLTAANQLWVQYAHFEKDLRAMRKVDRGVLFGYWDNIGIGGSVQAIRLYGRVRSLVLT